VRTALRLIRRRGPAALTVREVAKLAGASASAVYRHFADKEALLAAVAAEGFARLNAAFAAALETQASASPRARLEALGHAYVAFALKHPEHYRLMFGDGRTDSRDARLKEEAERSFRYLEGAVTAALAKPLDDPAVIAAAVAAWSLVHGYALLKLGGNFRDIPDGSLPDTPRLLAHLLTGDAD